jgi:hypothetical protein
MLLQSQYYSNPIPRQLSNLEFLSSKNWRAIDIYRASVMYGPSVLVLDSHGAVRAYGARISVRVYAGRACSRMMSARC